VRVRGKEDSQAIDEVRLLQVMGRNIDADGNHEPSGIPVLQLRQGPLPITHSPMRSMSGWFSMTGRNKAGSRRPRRGMIPANQGFRANHGRRCSCSRRGW